MLDRSRAKLEGRKVIREGHNLSHITFVDTITTEVCAQWRGNSSINFEYATNPAKTADLVKLRNEYLGTALGPDETDVAFLEDVGSFLDKLYAQFDAAKLREYARWYTKKNFASTYPVLVTRTACETYLDMTKNDNLFDFARFEFKKA